MTLIWHENSPNISKLRDRHWKICEHSSAFLRKVLFFVRVGMAKIPQPQDYTLRQNSHKSCYACKLFKKSMNLPFWRRLPVTKNKVAVVACGKKRRKCLYSHFVQYKLQHRNIIIFHQWRLLWGYYFDWLPSPPALRGFCTEMCAQPQRFCITENARGPGL